MIIDISKLKNVKTGAGYTVGELPVASKVLPYLKKGALVGEFEGVNSALDFILKNMKTAKGYKSSSKAGNGRFNSFKSFKEAVDTFRNEADTITKFDETQIAVTDLHESGTDVDFDVAGDFIDMGRYLEGVPEAYGVMQNGSARNRRMTMYINCTYWAGLNQAEINHRGERILRLIDALETNGVRAEIRGVISNECGHMEVVMKHHDESLVLTDLAVLAHSEWLRRIGFRFYEYSSTYRASYGSAVAFHDAIRPEIIEPDANDEIGIYVDCNMRGTTIDQRFEQAEKIIQWELSKSVPEIASINIGARAFSFHGNGSRPELELIREGREVVTNV